ncbi:MAG: hypothetical protein ACOX0L_04925 [Natronincolaceae bacterium]|nr:hypothetical protein [Bacillota bacterium]NLK91053.1 hypothetical protein [Clostridiales bacterium]
MNKLNRSNRRNAVLLVFLIIIILIAVGVSIGKINKKTGYTPPFGQRQAEYVLGIEL